MAKDRIVIPGIPTDAARVIIDRMREQDERIALLERKGGRPGIITTDTAAKVGELLNIEAPAAGLTIVLPQATQALRNARVTLSFRNENPVRIVCVLGTVNGDAFVLNDRPGTYDAICDGLGGWAVQVGVSEAGSGAGGSPDAEYVVGAVDATLPNARLATDSTEIDAVLTTPNVITWALNTASVVLSKLANLAGLSVLGRAANSSGVMAAITATAANQRLVSNTAGTSLEWVSDLPTTFDDTVSGALGTYILPVGFRNTDTLRLVLTGDTTIGAILLDGSVTPPEGMEINVCLSDQSGGSAPGWSLDIIDAAGLTGQFRTPGQVQGTNPGPSYRMQSEEEGCRCAFQGGAWRIIGGTAAQAITGDITVAAGNGSTRTSAITAGVIVNADVNAAAAIAQTKLGATTGFSVKASGASATTSAEPIVTYSASSNMSAERVTTSSTSITVSTSVANQIEFQRAALTGDVTASADSNTTAIAAGVIVDADVNASAAIALSKLGSQAQATIVGRAVGAGTGVPTALTGLQVGQVYKRGTFQLDTTSSGSVATYAISADTTQVLFQITGSTVTIHGLTATSDTFGKLIEFNTDRGFTGVIEFVDESGSAGAAGERIRTPNSQTIRMRANETVTACYWANRWRILSVCKRIDAEILAPADSNGSSVAFLIRAAFSATGAAGTLIDVTVWNANAPFALRIIGAELRVSTAAGTASALRTAAAGAGSVVLPAAAAATETFQTGATGWFHDTAVSTATVAAAGSLFLNVDRAVAGELILTCVRT